jgi:hypothetical protein
VGEVPTTLQHAKHMAGQKFAPNGYSLDSERRIQIHIKWLNLAQLVSGNKYCACAVDAWFWFQLLDICNEVVFKNEF